MFIRLTEAWLLCVRPMYSYFLDQDSLGPWYHGAAVTSSQSSGLDPTPNFQQGQTFLIVQGDRVIPTLLRQQLKAKI